MSNHIQNRNIIIQALKEELFGPSPQGKEIDCSGDIIFENDEESYGPWKQKDTGEEILLRDKPTVRYGVGVLYPVSISINNNIVDKDVDNTTSVIQEEENHEQLAENETITDLFSEKLEEIKSRGSLSPESDDYDFEISTANMYQQGSMGISFLGEIDENCNLIVEVTGGRYNKKRINVNNSERTWWLRSPVKIRAIFNGKTIMSNTGLIHPESCISENTDGLKLNIELYSRPETNERNCLITICLVNRSTGTSDEYHLFQSYFKVHIESPDKRGHILPYPGIPVKNMDKEEKSLSLLYRNSETFAVGHGCAANWEKNFDSKEIEWISAECLPAVEIPSITPDIKRDDNTLIEVSMASLAGLDPDDDGIGMLSDIINQYKKWIEKISKESFDKSHHREAAEEHIKQCYICLNRMIEGLDYLKEDKLALRAFKLANYAILLQQTHSTRETRNLQYDSKSMRFVYQKKYTEPDPLKPGENKGKWRPFQIAFLLMNVKSVANENDPNRNVVELIWFPTGGGKTEAYLGLISYSIFIRRLKNPADSGVCALMRYTLRLLTAQQFQRAAGLICAMEYIRNQYKSELGSGEFSIGIWLGSSTTPNSKKDAVQALRKLEKDKDSKNLFVLRRCPWCGSFMGRYEGSLPKNKLFSRVLGYENVIDTVIFKCPDNDCYFSKKLPVYAIDEDIYEKRPSLIIGTVDKFAMLAWKPKARTIFGINTEGKREFSPPSLIIQDELHLISGPLGSLVGLYETVIHELCTDYRNSNPVVPKIVCSTATIRRYADQIKALYARETVNLFPAPGIDANDSFFSKYATNQDGSLQPGRIFVGVHAPGLKSMQTTQVRTLTALLEAPMLLSNQERDPWWSLLIFFNSLRELGTTLSLFQSDIHDYFKVIKNRTGKNFNELRQLWNIMELTGRLRDDDIPKAINELEICYSNSNETPVDVCLASNIIEVGVDIDRLSLMTIVGQPKTTSQYIQVTGRIGRRWWERPGLAVTIYSASKPRDRSHFEKFRSYHERLYAQVEPTSVTPFSLSTLERALHAIMVIYARQTGNSHLSHTPYPYPDQLMSELLQIILKRAEIVDKKELENVKLLFSKRSSEWKKWERNRWETSWNDTEIPLIHEAGSYISPLQSKLSWAVQTSMRNVDAECQANITRLYLQEEVE